MGDAAGVDRARVSGTSKRSMASQTQTPTRDGDDRTHRKRDAAQVKWSHASSPSASTRSGEVGARFTARAGRRFQPAGCDDEEERFLFSVPVMRRAGRRPEVVARYQVVLTDAELAGDHVRLLAARMDVKLRVGSPRHVHEKRQSAWRPGGVIVLAEIAELDARGDLPPGPFLVRMEDCHAREFAGRAIMAPTHVSHQLMKRVHS